ncbi:ATP-binding cassette domain-containing protein [Ahrensia kielensis]|uniref:ATP-binding cassette domain-containing protein n=1 Tax=Ahrensia kielensis TaxID=76980 RepID=A0ABU9T457_9HYPH
MGKVTLSSVSKSYGQIEVIPPLDLIVQDGSFTVLVGPSGCGKSTLLRMISGLEDVTQGTIHIGGEDVTRAEPSDRGISMVFQSYALYPHMSVAENIGFSLRVAKRPKDEIAAAVRQAADLLQLSDYLDRKPRDLSGGQRQRVAIGRAIVRKPKVFLFDEPLSNLDASLRTQMRVELSDLHRRLGSTMIYVTHDQVEAMTMADQIVVLNKGRIEQAGTPLELYRRPVSPFVAKFIGSPTMNLVTGSAAQQFDCDTFGIRPEHITIGDKDALWTGTVRHVENLGAETIAYVVVPDIGEFIVRSDGQVPIHPGEQIGLAPNVEHGHRFRGEARI